MLGQNNKPLIHFISHMDQEIQRAAEEKQLSQIQIMYQKYNIKINFITSKIQQNQPLEAFLKQYKNLAITEVKSFGIWIKSH